MSAQKNVVFCFNHVLYNGDVNLDFFRHCLRKCKIKFILFPFVLYFLNSYKNDKPNKINHTNRLFELLVDKSDLDSLVSSFWKKNKKKLNKNLLSLAKEQNGISFPQFGV